MLTLNLTDALTFGADAKISDDAKRDKLGAGFSTLKDLRLNEVPIEQKAVQLGLEQPIAIANSGLKLTLGATSGGTLQVVTHGQGVLDDDDPFSIIQVNEREIYVRLTLS